MSDHISAVTLKHWLQDGAELALFDVREAGQFGEGHLFFAVPLPYSRLESEALRLAPRKTTRLVLVDEGDGLADTAARRLEALGYTRVHVLAQGVQAWRAAGYTLFKGVSLPSKTFGELVEHAYDTPHISAAELARWQQSGKAFVLLDGRTVQEHHKVTIPGAVACPNGELAYRIGALAPDPAVPVVINCAGRTRSILGAQTLRNLNLPNPVLALENGTQGWMLADLALEYGSQARYVDVPPADNAPARAAAQALRQRYDIPVLTAAQAQAWVDDDSRSTFVFDIRSEEEYRAGTLPGAAHAPGGQLIQATDQYLGVRNSRLILLDQEGIRAPVVASWLYQLGYEVAILEAGIATPLRLSAPSIPTLAVPPVFDVQQAARTGVPWLDIRASADYRRQRLVGAVWTTRAQLAAWVKQQPALPSTVVLVADSAQAAALAAQDLQEAGVAQVQWVAGIAPLVQAGWPTEHGGEVPPDAERIDYLFFVHDRHEGNRTAAEQYLAWETGLIGQCTADELAVFRIGGKAL